MRYPEDASKWGGEQRATRDRLAGLLLARFRLTGATAEAWATDLLVAGYVDVGEVDRVTREVALKRGARYGVQLAEIVVSIKADRRARRIAPPERQLKSGGGVGPRDPELPRRAFELAMDIFEKRVRPEDAEREWRRRRSGQAPPEPEPEPEAELEDRYCPACGEVTHLMRCDYCKVQTEAADAA